MDSFSEPSSLDEIAPQIQQIFNRVHQLQVDDQWINDYYLTNPLPPHEEQPDYFTTKDYYSEFWKVYLTNEMIVLKIKELAAVNDELKTHLQNLELFDRQSPSKSKKKRRTSAEIDKRFKCPYNGCQKAYGCDVSMNLHIKLKHNGGNKTQRQSIARMICEAEIMGRNAPQVKIKFPPGYLQKFKANYLTQRSS